MYVKDKFDDCSGCGLCVHICKQNAIEMVVGEDGFCYPKINEALCTNCNACRKICPFENEFVSDNQALESYAVKHSDDIRMQSSSGGFFTVLSDYILDNGGIVYGAVWTDEFSVEHIRAERKEERDRMRSSKYIQSNMDAVYKTIKEDVASGKLVLFTGTPCQCAAIFKMFGNKKPENLWIMDLICHGVLSQPFFDAYLQDIRNKHQKKTLVKINLRDKRFGLEFVGIDFDDGTVYNSEDDYFYKAYSELSLQRTSCFSCQCAKEYRFGDFTVGDFWGVNKNRPEFHDELGVSLVIINTEKAKALYITLKEKISSIMIQPEEYLPYNPNLRKSTVKGGRADKFLKYYQKYGYKKTMHRFFDVTIMRKINKIGYKFLQKVLRKG